MPSTSPVINRVVTPFPSVIPKTGPSNVLMITEVVIHPPIPAGFNDIKSIIHKYENQNGRAHALAQARKRLSSALTESSQPTLSSLRLRAGLSQAKLAALLGNSQSSYSLIEAGHRDILYTTFEKLIEILQVSRDELALAIKNSKSGE